MIGGFCFAWWFTADHCTIAANLSNIEDMEETEKWHGRAGGYTNHRCRCTQCRTAWADYVRERRQRKARGE